MLRICGKLPSLLTTVLLASLSGCGMFGASEPESVETAITEDSSICAYQWLLESLSVDGREHRSRLLWQKLWRDRPYLTCDKLGYVRGSAGSNPYIGRFAVSADGEISWPKVPAISRMSDTRDSSELEKDYLKALPQTDSMKMEGDSLIMQGDHGATRLEFKRIEEMPK
ncbi:META domain-containing protein [Microbulbifer hainanensis]|uniref:META domain-containing protein n=1 Tax=Microbulbifer hainanensis TaxID=2735675 RepID=UPI00186848B8|nr:META domain-containing protein [Microbulbifer hainanensis]